MLHSAAASCDRSLMPSKRPSSSNATALTIRPSSRASRTRSVRYSSPVVADGVRASIRRRSHAASKAYSPALISLPASSSGVASLRLDDPLDGPELAADDAPELGRVGGEDAGQRDRGVVLAARLEDGVEVGAGHQRHVAGQDQDLGRLVGHDAESRPDRVAGAARLVLEREDRAIGEDVDEGRDRRRVDDDGTPGPLRRPAVLAQASRT